MIATTNATFVVLLVTQVLSFRKFHEVDSSILYDTVRVSDCSGKPTAA